MNFSGSYGLWVIIPIVLILVLFWADCFGGGVVSLGFRDRICQGRFWRNAFPRAQVGEIREFLEIFASSFAFKKSQKLLFSPDDSVLTVYRAIYADAFLTGVDALELETLTIEIQKRYGVELAAVWHERLTLGQLFDICIQSNSESIFQK